MINVPKEGTMTLRIDGTDEHGNLSGDARTGPFAVFDEENQTWLITRLRYRWLAWLIIRLAPCPNLTR